MFAACLLLVQALLHCCWCWCWCWYDCCCVAALVLCANLNSSAHAYDVGIGGWSSARTNAVGSENVSVDGCMSFFFFGVEIQTLFQIRLFGSGPLQSYGHNGIGSSKI
jgi:hypothetical protein